MENNTFLNRPILKEVKVSLEGDFQSYYEAERILKEEGFITGSMCGPEPIGFAPAEECHYIAKWYNISPSERKLVHGVMYPEQGSTFRNGTVRIIYFGDI
jgi:hypothetical protein